MFRFFFIASLFITISADLQATDTCILDDQGSVKFTEQPLLEQAYNLEFCKGIEAHFSECSSTGQLSRDTIGIQFLKQINACGVGQTLLVFDGDFEADASSKFLLKNDFVVTQSPKVAHGTVVSACAVSVHEQHDAIARGAWVLPLSLLQLVEQLISQQKLKIQASEKTWKEKNASTLHDDPTDHFAQYIYEKNVLVSLLKQSRFTITDKTLDKVEYLIKLCAQQNIPTPHVINMSLSATFEFYKEKQLLDRLEKILKANDILLVIAAGNDSDEDKSVAIGGDVSQSNYKSIMKNERDLLECLEDYPELSKNILVACAFSKQSGLSEYSTRSGTAKKHTIVSFGTVFDSTTFAPNGQQLKKGKYVEGTSFAAPRVSAAALILKKYFPQFSMPEIKQILIDSAYKPQDLDEEAYGNGMVDVLKAWVHALEKKKAYEESQLSLLSTVSKRIFSIFN